MANVIDTLIVELGLDPKKFTKGQQEAMSSFKRAQEEQQRRAKSFEDVSNKVGQTFGKLRNQAMGFVAALLGGRELKEFVQYLVQTDAATGRLSYRVGASTEKLTAWGGAVKMLGGSSEGFMKSVEGLVQEFQRFAATGESAVLPYFNALQVRIADATGKMRPFEEILGDLANAFGKLTPQQATFFGNALGFDEGTVNLLIKGGEAVKKLVDQSERMGVVSKAAAENAQQLQTSWNRLEQGAISLGRALFNSLGGGSVLDWMSEGIEGFIKSEVESHKPRRRSLGPGGTSAPAPAAGGSRLRIKPGNDTGGASLGVQALAQSLQAGIPELNQFTAFNDAYHSLLGGSSKHSQGLALDFSINDPKKSAEVAAAIRARLAELGVRGYVRDEYANPSKNSTGPHIHVQFAGQEWAEKFAAIAQNEGGAGIFGGGSRSSTTNIGTINVITKATDAEGIARELPGALGRNNPSAVQSQGGPS